MIRRHLGATALLVLALGGCSLMRPAASPGPVFHTLDLPLPRTPPGAPAPATAPSLLVQPTRAAAAFDSPRMLYRREAHRLAAFAYNEWAEPPARMLAPLLLNQLEQTGAFRAVVLSTGAAAADYRLDTELIVLLQDFGQTPSRVHLSLRATLVQDATRRVVAVRQFDLSVDAPSEDPQGGVLAANQAVAAVLRDLAAFSASAIGRDVSLPGAAARPPASFRPTPSTRYPP
jgi:cholesterol transport system auxiliary component